MPAPSTAPQSGLIDPLRPGLRRILAPNPGPMTYWGTNTFLIGDHDVAVIDPGPDHPDHLRAIMDAVPAPSRITHIFVTHPHLDHSGLAKPLSVATGAPIYAFGPAAAGRSDIMQKLAEMSAITGGEGVDAGFQPDHSLSDGDNIRTPEWHIKAVHLPGHMASHLGFLWQDCLFCGDLIMAWSSSLISPPDGDLGQFFQSLTRLGTMEISHLIPAHGPDITPPDGRIKQIETHLKQRSTQIRQTLTHTPLDLMQITRHVYHDLAAAALPYAARNTLAHLIHLHGSGRAIATPEISEIAMWTKG